MKNDGSWDFSFWGIILTGVLFLMAYGAGQWTARQAEAGFFGPSDHLEASADGNWGLGFPEKGKTPVGNASAEYLKQYHYILLILDINLPDGNGFELYSELIEKSNASIIFLTANDLENDIVKGFDLGADDYIINLFDSKDLVARVRAVLRRFQVKQPSPSSSEKCVTYPDLTVNLTNYAVTYMGRQVDMPPKELELLYFLAASPNQVFTREQLQDHIWGYEYIGDTRTVDVHIKRLREKIKDNPHWSIATVWGIGYKFEVKNP